VLLVARTLVGASILAALALAQDRPASGPASPYAKWSRGPSHDPKFFPIAIWLQRPADAALYAKAGVNTYVGLWKGPTEEHLAQLKAAGMSVFCEMNDVGRKHLADPTIVGWMHGDEPDNAQALPDGKGWGPPVAPAEVVKDYERLRAADPSRPVLLNLGQGVAWDGWYGRGVRSRHPEDYPLYLEGCDLASFDIYPVTHEKPEVRGKLWLVPFGVERLRAWSGDTKPVWNCLECTRISSDTRPSPAEVRAEAWMGLVAGSRGLIWFVHEWKPKFSERRLLEDGEMLEAVTALNHEIHGFAEVLNAPTVPAAVRVRAAPADVPIGCLLKRTGRTTHLFAINQRPTKVKAAFELVEGADATARVHGEGRAISIKSGRFEDAFEPYALHVYVME
jgi:hypothetical protein